MRWLARLAVVAAVVVPVWPVAHAEAQPVCPTTATAEEFRQIGACTVAGVPVRLTDIFAGPTSRSGTGITISPFGSLVQGIGQIGFNVSLSDAWSIDSDDALAGRLCDQQSCAGFVANKNVSLRWALPGFAGPGATTFLVDNVDWGFSASVGSGWSTSRYLNVNAARQSRITGPGTSQEVAVCSSGLRGGGLVDCAQPVPGETYTFFGSKQLDMQQILYVEPGQPGTRPAGTAEVYLRSYRVTVQITTAPEPSTYALLGTGLLTLGGIAVRRRKHLDA